MHAEGSGKTSCILGITNALEYCRFIAGPTLNFFFNKSWFFWKLSLNVVGKVAKVEFFFSFLFIAECNFSTLIDYSTNMCWTSYEPTLVDSRWVSKTSYGEASWHSIKNEWMNEHMFWLLLCKEFSPPSQIYSGISKTPFVGGFPTLPRGDALELSPWKKAMENLQHKRDILWFITTFDREFVVLLTKPFMFGWFCKQSNQLPIKSHDELKDNSNRHWRCS